MSLKSSLLALAENIGMCQENARSIKQALAGGLADAADNSVVNYSTDEQDTGIAWTNGDAIYQKTISIANDVSVTADTWTTIDTGTWIGSISKLIDVKYQHVNGGFYSGFHYKVSGNNLQIYCPTNFTVAKYTSVTIQYRKASS